MYTSILISLLLSMIGIGGVGGIEMVRINLIEKMSKPNSWIKIDDCYYPICTHILSSFELFRNLLLDINSCELLENKPIIISICTDELPFMTLEIFSVWYNFLILRVLNKKIESIVLSVPNQIKYILMINYLLNKSEIKNFYVFIEYLQYSNDTYTGIVNYEFINRKLFFDADCCITPNIISSIINNKLVNITQIFKYYDIPYGKLNETINKNICNVSNIVWMKDRTSGLFYFYNIYVFDHVPYYFLFDSFRRESIKIDYIEKKSCVHISAITCREDIIVGYYPSPSLDPLLLPYIGRKKRLINNGGSNFKVKIIKDDADNELFLINLNKC